MPSMHKVYLHNTGRVHLATARRADLAALSRPEDVTAENWWHWRTLCGKDVIGRATESSVLLAGYEVNCRACERTVRRDDVLYAKLTERYGLR